MQKTSLKKKRNPNKGNKYRAGTLPRSKKIPLTTKGTDGCQGVSLTGKKDVRICCWRNLLPNLAIKTQLATPGKEIPEQQGKYCIALDLRRTNSITRKLCLATAINLQMAFSSSHFLTLACLIAFIPPFPL